MMNKKGKEMVEVNKTEIISKIVNKFGGDEVNYRSSTAIYDFIIMEIKKQLGIDEKLPPVERPKKEIEHTDGYFGYKD